MADLVKEILDFLTGLGYWGVMLGLMIEVIPSEIVLAYAGFLVYQGEITFFEAVLFGTIGGVIAQIFVYWIGRYGGRPFLDRFGKYILISKKHIDHSETWFKKYGTGVIFTARFIPVVRHAISIPAGMARMSLLSFTLYTTLAVIPWSIAFVYLGTKLSGLGKSWDQIDEISGPYIRWFILGAIGLTILYVVYTVWRKKAHGHKAYSYQGGKTVFSELKKLPRDYQIMNRRHVQAGRRSQEFDHIVIGPNGIFHIETKNWGGDITFTSEGVKRSKEGNFEDPTAQLYRYEGVLRGLMQSQSTQADLVGILCFAQPDSRIHGKSPAFRTVKLEQLVNTISKYHSKKPLTASQIKEITQLIKANSKPS